jgi:hypothetical protein
LPLYLSQNLIASIEASGGGFFSKTNGQFKVVIPGRTYEISAETGEEMKEWVRVLQEAKLESSKESTEPPGNHTLYDVLRNSPQLTPRKLEPM